MIIDDDEDEAQPEQEDSEADPKTISSRQPVLVNDSEFHMDQKLVHAKMSMQGPIYTLTKHIFCGFGLRIVKIHGVHGHQLHAQELARQHQVPRDAVGVDEGAFPTLQTTRRSWKLGEQSLTSRSVYWNLKGRDR